MRDILRPLLKSPELPLLLKELEAFWQKEQARRHAFWAEQDEGQKAEFIEGEIIYHSPVYGRHWKVSSNIIAQLLPYVRQNDLGEVAYEKAMIRCTRNDYEPDICFWNKEKSKDFEEKQSAFPPPDFIIEILSESTRERNRGIKLSDYALHEVAEYWIIDPEEKAIEQYLQADKQYQLSQKLKSGSLLAQAIPGFQIEVSQIFAGF